MSLFNHVTGAIHLPKSNIYPDLWGVRFCNSQSSTCWKKLHIWAAGGGAGDSYKSERLHTHPVGRRDGKAAVVLPTTSLPSRSQGDNLRLKQAHLKSWMCVLDLPCNLRGVQMQMVCSVREWLRGFTLTGGVILILDRMQLKVSA